MPCSFEVTTGLFILVGTRGPTRLKSRTPSVEIQPEIRNPKRNPEIQQEI